MIKKILVLMLSLACVLSFAACSSRDPEPADNGDNTDSSSAEESVATTLPATSFVEAPNYSVQEAAANNAEIQDADIDLIQFKPGSGTHNVTISTSEGDIKVELYRDQAPLAVDNFITHAKNGYYNGMEVYKAVNNFLIQSGAPADKASESIYQDEEGENVDFPDEFDLSLWNFRGALTMQNRGRPNSNSSEFFIVQAGPVYDEDLLAEMEAIKYPASVIEKYKDLGGVPGFDWRHTVFGMVTDGMDVVDAIAAAETDAFGEPVETILIKSITVM